MSPVGRALGTLVEVSSFDCRIVSASGSVVPNRDPKGLDDASRPCDMTAVL